jgi:hypothetical protein
MPGFRPGIGWRGNYILGVGVGFTAGAAMVDFLWCRVVFFFFFVAFFFVVVVFFSMVVDVEGVGAGAAA